MAGIYLIGGAMVVAGVAVWGAWLVNSWPRLETTRVTHPSYGGFSRMCTRHGELASATETRGADR